MQDIIAPDLRESPDFHTPIWRYLTVGKFLSMLEMRAVWFSRLGALIDLYEGTIPEITKRAMEEDSQKWLPHFPHPEHQRMIAEMADKNEEDGRAVLAVNCWFMGKHESPQMWEAYSSVSEGVAVRSSCQRLATSVTVHREFSRVQKVRYVDFATEDMGLYRGNQAIERAFLKRKEYAGEQELRIATMNLVHPNALNEDGTPPTARQLSGPGMFDESRRGLYILANLHNLIESVWVSPKAHGWFYDMVKRVLLRYGLSCNVNQSRLQG
jgi:hypothetical protein